jgi:hypothetical protein
MTPLPRTRVVKMPAHRATVIGKLVPPAAVPPHSAADGMRPVVPGRVARRTRCSPATAVMRLSPPGTAGTIRRCTRSGEARRSRAPVVPPRGGVLGVLRGTVHLVMGIMATVLFFGSIIVRELSRTLRALREGVQRQRDHSLAVRRRVSRRRAAAHPQRRAPGGPRRIAGVRVLALGFWASPWSPGPRAGPTVSSACPTTSPGTTGCCSRSTWSQRCRSTAGAYRSLRPQPKGRGGGSGATLSG